MFGWKAFLSLLIPMVCLFGVPGFVHGADELHIHIEYPDGEAASGVICEVLDSERHVLTSARSDAAGHCLLTTTSKAAALLRVGEGAGALVMELNSRAQQRLIFVLQENGSSRLLSPGALFMRQQPECAGQLIDESLLTDLPLERTLSAPLELLPGYSTSDAPLLHGSSPRDNRFLIDAADATDPFSGTLELHLPFSSLRVLQSAAALLSTGDAVHYSTVTPPGRREQTSIDATFLFEQSGAGQRETDPLVYGRDRNGFDAEAIISTPLGSNAGLSAAFRYRQLDIQEPRDRFVPQMLDVPAGMFRFNWQPGNWLISAAAYASSRYRETAFAPLLSETIIRESNTEAVTSSKQVQVFLGRITASRHFRFGTLEGHVERYDSERTIEPTDGNRFTASSIDTISDPDVLIQGSVEPLHRDLASERTTLGVAIQSRPVALVGVHNLSLMARVVSSEFNDIRGYNGDFSFDYSSTLETVFRRRFLTQTGAPEDITDQRYLDTMQVELVDTWLAGGFRISAGVLLDSTTAGNRSAELFDWQSVSPRLTISRDLLGDGRFRVFAGYRKVHHRLLGIQIPGDGYAEVTQFFNFNGGFWETPSGGIAEPGYQPGLLEGKIQRPWAEVYQAGLDLAAGPRTSLSLLWTSRRERDLFETVEVNLFPTYVSGMREDALDRQYTYFLRRPGLDGTLKERFVLRTVPELERTYNGLDLAVRTAPDAALDLYAAYTWSRTEGTIDNTLESSTGSSAVLNDPNERINADGFLSSDNRHRLLLALRYRLPWQIQLGLLARMETGLPIARLLLNPDDGTYSILAEPRGEIWRQEARTGVDLRISKELFLQHLGHFRLWLDLFNLTDSSIPVQYDQRDDFFGLPRERMEPRRWRMGINWTF